MAYSTVDPNNKLIQFVKEINREAISENMFSPYMGEGLNAIIRRRYEPKQGGEQINIPLVSKLTGAAVGTGTLVGNEDAIDNYGMRVWVDWKRKAVSMKKSESQKDSADLFGEAKPLLSDWAKEEMRDDLIEALMALPSESAPANLGSADTVNGIRYQNATAAERNAWNAANSDRILFGNAVSNYNATHATALANIDANDDKFTKTSLGLLKRIARTASTKIRPFTTKDGYEQFVLFAGSSTFRDLASSLEQVNREARAREGRGFDNNPLFQSGDLMYDGVLVREVPEISKYVTDVWTTLKTAGASSARVEPVFLCGQQAATVAYGQPFKATFRSEDDYGFIQGVGTEACYGVSKMFKKHNGSLKQWGVVTGFFAGALDA